MNHRTAGATLATAALLTAAVACSSPVSNHIGPLAATSSPSVSATVLSSAPTIGVGQTAEFASQFTGEQGTTIRLTVSKVDYATSGTDAIGVNRPTRGIYVRVTMTATNVGSNTGIFDAANFVWISPQGEAIPNTATLGTAADAIPTVALQPGQKVSGVAIYDVPAKGGKLQYEIRIDLPVPVAVDLPLL